MKGNRKLVIALAFMAGAFGLSIVSVLEAQPLSGVATVIAAIGAGLVSVIWGNVQEHRAQNGGSQ